MNDYQNTSSGQFVYTPRSIRLSFNSFKRNLNNNIREQKFFQKSNNPNGVIITRFKTIRFFGQMLMVGFQRYSS